MSTLDEIAGRDAADYESLSSICEKDRRYLLGLVREARDYIDALNGLLAAYRIGTNRTPEKALRTLDRLHDLPRRLTEGSDRT